MVSAVKEICIFMIIAQAVMFFVPGGSYMKYVRILVGILMILRITEPVLTFLANEEAGQEIADRMSALWEGMDQSGQDLLIEDGSIGIYQGIGKEIQTRLNQCQSSFEVQEVELADEEGQIIVTVSPRNAPDSTLVSTLDSAEKKGAVYIEPIVLGEERPEKIEKEATEEELGRLRELYGGLIEVDPERIIIRYKEGAGGGR